MTDIQQTNPVREQVLGTAGAILGQFDRLESQTRKVLSTPEIFAARHIVLTGCGDSHMAAAGTQLAFEQFVGVPVQALRAMEAGRYTLPAINSNTPNNPLVIGISSSGEVARTFEALQIARKLGAMTIALTSRPESRVGRAAERVVVMDPADLPAAPGFYGYILSMVALNLLAIRMGEVRGRLTQDEASTRRTQLRQAIEAIDTIIAAVDKPIREQAAAWAELENYEFLGSGPSMGTAMFGAAKLLEASGVHALAQDIEEWAHLQFFVARPETTGTVLISPAGRAKSRAIEVAQFLHSLERPTMIVADSDHDFPQASRVIRIPVQIDELFSPIVYSVPLALYAGYQADATRSEYGRGHKGRWSDSHNGTSIRQSQIAEL